MSSLLHDSLPESILLLLDAFVVDRTLLLGWDVDALFRLVEVDFRGRQGGR